MTQNTSMAVEKNAEQPNGKLNSTEKMRWVDLQKMSIKKRIAFIRSRGKKLEDWQIWPVLQ